MAEPFDGYCPLKGVVEIAWNLVVCAGCLVVCTPRRTVEPNS